MSWPKRLPGRATIVSVAVTLAGLGLVVIAEPQTASAASSCDAMTKSVHLFVDTKRSVGLLTYNSARFADLKKSGYTDRGVAFLAAGKTTGLVGAHVMYAKSTHDRIYSTSKSEISSLKKKGYKDNGIAYYVSSSSSTCLTAVYRLNKGKLHRYVALTADRDSLVASGWKVQKTAFWAKAVPVGTPSPSSSAFTIAVMPDTQQEVLSATDTRFADRSAWLVKNADSLNLKFVTHTGDIVNWDTSDHIQYVRAKAALEILNKAAIPYSLSPGNHDTGAVCPGGSACPGAQTWVTVRDTTSFNNYLNEGVADRAGSYASGKVDNTYSRFAAGGASWLVLNLELWPRTDVVTWAKSVVASHPNDNVIVVTHSYLTASGGIYQTNGGYGATSPQYLYDNLISKYANIRMVLSGHTGQAAHRVDVGASGNRIDSFLLAMHSTTTNPVRLIQIDPSNGLLKSWVYAPDTAQTYTSYAYATGGISWVK